MEIKTGDLVTISDGSFAIRVDKYELDVSIGICKDLFKIIQLNVCQKALVVEFDFPTSSKKIVHDIIIKNTRTGEMYLHSSPYVRLHNKVKITVNDRTVYISRESAETLGLI